MAKKEDKKNLKNKKEVEKKNKGIEARIRVWKIVNFAIIMASVVFMVVNFVRTGVQNVWWNYDGQYVTLEKSLINDVVKMMTVYSLETIGVYAILQIYYYILYIFKLQKTLLVSVLLSGILIFTEIGLDIDLYAILFPIVSVVIYMRMMDLEKKL